MYNRIMVGVFLQYNEKLLLMHRGKDRKIAANMWSCVGGHMEVEDKNDITETCYRELKEETGISRELVKNLKLRYITTRILDNEFRNVYLFWGTLTQECELKLCDEGTFHWIDVVDLHKKEMTFSVQQVVKHWLNDNIDDNTYICVINKTNDDCIFASI